MSTIRVLDKINKNETASARAAAAVPATRKLRICTQMELPPGVTYQHCRSSSAAADSDGTNPSIRGQRAAFLVSRLWSNGQILRVRFIGGTEEQRLFVKKLAKKWAKNANIKFKFVADDRTSHIRVGFVDGDGSWSYVGTDALAIPQNERTMNFGWLEPVAPTDPAVVLHEFGHAIGLVHEHQSPVGGGLSWNEAQVIADLSGPPNFWDEPTIRFNVLDKYNAVDLLTSATLDPLSIMMYSFPASWTTNGFSAPFNEVLSELDKQTARIAYPHSA